MGLHLNDKRFHITPNTIYPCACEDFMEESDEEWADLVLTSPPYADMRDYVKIPPDEYVDWFLPKAKLIYKILKKNGVFVLNIRNHIVAKARHTYVYDLIHQIHTQVGFDLIEDIVWDKVKVLPNSKGKRPMDMWEFALVFGKGTEVTWNPDPVRTPYGERTLQRYKTDVKVRWHSIRDDRGDRRIELNPLGAYPKNIIRIPSEATRTGHPASFPIEFAEWFVKSYSNAGDIVYDPFGGAGTTAIAAQRNGRKWILTEIHEEYITRAKERLVDEPEALF